jgi:molecular chaperone DnaK
MAYIIGIDLGTINSLVAVIKDGKPVVIPNQEGSFFTPSVVAYNQNGICLVGQAAKRQAFKNPENTFDLVMQFIGCENDEVAEKAKQVSYSLLATKEGIKIPCPILNRNFAPEEILAQILSQLAYDASQYLGEAINQVVITVPAFFNYAQRFAVQEASRIAGLKLLRMINRPAAVALAYGLNKTDDETILILDLGRNHFNLLISELGNKVFESLAYIADVQIGGNNFERKVVEWLIKEFKKLEGVDLSQNQPALQRLTEAAEKAKIELSSANETEINLPWIAMTGSAGKHLNMTLTRSQFENICRPLISQYQNAVENGLRDAKLNKSDINEVLLVGGSTRIPVVQQLVQQMFGKEHNQRVNKDESAVVGAAIIASILAGDLTGILLLDETSISLGVETEGSKMTRVLPRNITIPTKKTEVFSTAMDKQTYVDIHILQGEQEMASDNKTLAILRLDGIPPAPHGVPQIEVTFDIDANGLLNVIAKEKNTGKQKSILISRASILFAQEYMMQKRSAKEVRHRQLVLCDT